MTREIGRDDTQRFLLPPSLDDWVAPAHPVRFVVEFVESLDLEALGFRPGKEAGEPGRTPYSSSLLLSVWVFGWMERIRSSRGLEKACLRDVAFMWLTGNQHPDHNTLWRFFKDHKAALRKLFKQTVQLAVEAKLVGFVEHALDGTKLKAASATRTALHEKKLKQKLAKLDAIIDESMKQIEAAEGPSDEVSYRMPEALSDAKERRRVIAQGLAKLAAAEAKHLHEKEPEARVVKHGTENTLGYNAQVVVDAKSDLIVAQDVVADETDNAQLMPMIEKVQETAGARADETLADSGYFNAVQLAKAESESVGVLVKPKGDKNDDGEFHKSRFRYDAQRDGYVCPRGDFLPLEVLRRGGEGMALRYDTATYRCHNAQCPARPLCTTAKSGRTIIRGEHEEVLERARASFAEPAAMKRYLRRGAIVEHQFALAKTTDGFRRFSVRGLEGARAQWALLCSALNLRKLYKYWATLGPSPSAA
jgi:transposase